jgi:hypothetical protein
VDLGAEDQALGFDQEVALAAAELLGPVVAALPTDAGRLDRLAVQDPGAGLRVLARASAVRGGPSKLA